MLIMIFAGSESNISKSI